jgi:hypothetical protein
MQHKLLKALQTALPHSTVVMMEFGQQLLLVNRKTLQGHNRQDINRGWAADREGKQKDGEVQTKIRRGGRGRYKR